MSKPSPTPDVLRAHRFVAAYPPPGRLIQCGVTGAHLYGFPSLDSDVDLKGLHSAPLDLLLGLDEPKETHDVLLDFEGVEHDLTTHEVAKALRLLLRGNGNILERFLSPFQLVQSEEVEALQSLARGAISKRFVGHYRGFFRGMQREHGLHHRAKTLLYSYRVALTGAHLLSTGELVGDVTTLAPRYGFESVLALVRLKAELGEKTVLDEATERPHCERWPELEKLLQRSLTNSSLPDEPPNRSALNQWLLDLRRG